MQIILDHEGITFDRGEQFTTFFWTTLFMTFFSSQYGKVFFTPIHYIAYILAQKFKRKEPVAKDFYDSGALSFYHMTTTVLNAETKKGNENFAILLNTGELREFLALTKDFRDFNPGETEGILAVVRSSSAENLSQTVKALHTVGAIVIAQVYDGVESSDH